MATWSPTLIPRTWVPTASTTPAPSWPRTIGRMPTGRSPRCTCSSVWHRPTALTCTCTSVGSGGSRVIVSTERGPRYDGRARPVSQSWCVQSGPTTAQVEFGQQVRKQRFRLGSGCRRTAADESSACRRQSLHAGRAGGVRSLRDDAPPGLRERGSIAPLGYLLGNVGKVADPAAVLVVVTRNVEFLTDDEGGKLLSVFGGEGRDVVPQGRGRAGRGVMLSVPRFRRTTGPRASSSPAPAPARRSLLGQPRNGRKNARMSPTNSSGLSSAAKWPPCLYSVNWVTL